MRFENVVHAQTRGMAAFSGQESERTGNKISLPIRVGTARAMA